MKKGIGAGAVIAVVLLGAFWMLTSGASDSTLSKGAGPLGALDGPDANHDGAVTRAEIEGFVAERPERSVGMVDYFDQYDTDFDSTLSPKEMDRIPPPYSFGQSDLNGDGVLTREEVEVFASARLYRQIGLREFFDLVDTNADGIVSGAEMAAAHKAGQFADEDS